MNFNRNPNRVAAVTKEVEMHEGHRRRMYEKLKNGGLYEHELLEVLLFNAYPRKNTNPIAHALLDAFGSIQGVFNAEVEELAAVAGVGESVALYLKCIGECVARAGGGSGKDVVLKNYEDFKAFSAMRMRGETQEVIEIYCMEKNGRVGKAFAFTSNEGSRVRVDADKVAGAIAGVKPYGILVAHNHLSGNCEPSENDDRFTMELQVMCSMNGVRLYDHCICAADGVFSYFTSGRIDAIKSNYSFEKLVGEQFKKDRTVFGGVDSDKTENSD